MPLTVDEGTSRAPYVAATGFRVLLPWYDFLVSFCTCERETKQILVDEISILDPGRILDVGCGTGTLLESLTQQWKAADAKSREIYAVDPDPFMVARAKAKLGVKESLLRNLNVQQGRADELGFADDFFPLVVSSLVFHHLTAEEKQASLEEIKRVLSPDGRLLLLDFGAPRNWTSALKFLVVRFFDGWSQTRDNVEDNMTQLCVQAGFRGLREQFVKETWLGSVYLWELAPN